MNRTRGFTLIELLIVVAILAVLALVGFRACGGISCGRGSAEHAEQEARAHAQKLGWALQGIACTGMDTDGDGYISCTVILTDLTERALECASGGFKRISGCKAAPFIKAPGARANPSGIFEDPDEF